MQCYNAIMVLLQSYKGSCLQCNRKKTHRYYRLLLLLAKPQEMTWSHFISVEDPDLHSYELKHTTEPQHSDCLVIIFDHISSYFDHIYMQNYIKEVYLVCVKELDVTRVKHFSLTNPALIIVKEMSNVEMQLF